MALTLQGGVTKNVTSGLSGAGSGALAGASAGPIGAAVGGLIGAGASLLGNLGNKGSTSAVDLNIQDMYNMEMYNTIKDLFFMNEQNKYNKSNMDYQAKLNAESEERQFNYQKALAQQQFDYNNYFIDNAYQKTVADLRKAGINPLLATQNGSNVGSVGMGSATALGSGLPSASAVTGSGTDLANFLSASASSANAKTAREQLKINLMNGLTDIMTKYANSSLALQQAETEVDKRELMNSQQALNLVDEQQRKLDYQLNLKYSDKDRLLSQKKTLASIKNETINALANYTNSQSNKVHASAHEYEAKTNRYDTILRNSNYLGNPIVGKMYLPTSAYDTYLNKLHLYD